MNACNDAGLPIMAARERLAVMGWIPPRSEYFHHVPPPAADVWLGEAEAEADARIQRMMAEALQKMPRFIPE